MIKTYTRKTHFSELKEFCYLSPEHSFIEVTEWKNGEGVDVVIDSQGVKQISLTFGEFDALKKIIEGI